MSGEDWRPEGPGGKVRLFPLPDLVMFPHVVQALHIFEPRYVAMVEEALAGDRQIAMVLLRDGWKLDKTHAPPIHPTACLGRIVSHVRLDNGRYNLLLAGVVRARIERELKTGVPFRVADVQWQTDQYANPKSSTLERLRDRLLELFRLVHPSGLAAQKTIQNLLRDHVTLGMLTDVITFGLRLPVATKQQLLDCPEVERRAKLLVRCMESLSEAAFQEGSGPSLTFPPDFSLN